MPIKRSVTDDYIVCLEDGKKLKMLKRHLMTAYGMTPEAYRAKWGLRPDYPVVAPNYSAQRQALAKQTRPRPEAGPATASAGTETDASAQKTCSASLHLPSNGACTLTSDRLWNEFLPNSSLLLMAKTMVAARSKRAAKQASGRGGPALKPPPFRPVQLAKLVDKVPTGDRWLHEMKYDGYRLELAVGDGEARAYTRSGLDWSDRFDCIVEQAARLDVRSALIDGEAVVMDAAGRSSFQALQGALKGAPDTIDYFAFDLLELNGDDLTSLPLVERKAKLREILPEGDPRIRYSDHIEGNGEKLLHSFCDAGLEGVISKLATAKYVGSRSGGWLKTKCIKRQEFVVVGWTPSDKSRAFRSLVLGVHDQGELRYAGKVGTGFTMDEILRLMERMKPLEQKDPTVKAPRAEVRGARLAQAQAGRRDRLYRDDQ